MTVFDIDSFETRVRDLLTAYQTLEADHEALKAAHRAERQRNEEIRQRLSRVIERIRSLENEARLDTEAQPDADIEAGVDTATADRSYS